MMQLKMLLIDWKKCVADVSAWMKNNSLKISEDKTEFIIFHRDKESTSRYTLQVNK